MTECRLSLKRLPKSGDTIRVEDREFKFYKPQMRRWATAQAFMEALKASDSGHIRYIEWSVR
jgi:hypothetical protein